MKSKLFALIAVIGLCVSAQAQTDTNAPSNFLQSVGGYFSSSNPQLPIAGRMEVSIGTAYQNGLNFASDFGLRVKLSTNSSGFFGESVTRNAGVAGVVVSEQIGGGYYVIPASAPDVEISAGLLGGYRFDETCPAVTIYADVRKMLTANTYSGIRLGYEWQGRQKNTQPPVVSLIWGVRF